MVLRHLTLPITDYRIAFRPAYRVRMSQDRSQQMSRADLEKGQDGTLPHETERI